jgi:hypothetical protein
MAYFLDNYIGSDDCGNVVMSEVDAFMYVLLSKAEMHVPYGGLVGNVINEVSHKPRSL